MSEISSTVEQPDDGDINKLKAELASQIERANQAEGRLKAHILDAALERAATRSRAFNAAQIGALLKPKAEVFQETDKDGKPRDGEYGVKVKGDDGESLSPRQAVERLRTTDPNMFLSLEELRSGNTGPREGESNIQMMARLAKSNPGEYHRLRKEQPHLLGLKRKSR
jgi:hypothetical protein